LHPDLFFSLSTDWLRALIQHFLGWIICFSVRSVCRWLVLIRGICVYLCWNFAFVYICVDTRHLCIFVLELGVYVGLCWYAAFVYIWVEFVLHCWVKTFISSEKTWDSNKWSFSQVFNKTSFNLKIWRILLNLTFHP